MTSPARRGLCRGAPARPRAARPRPRERGIAGSGIGTRKEGAPVNQPGSALNGVARSIVGGRRRAATEGEQVGSRRYFTALLFVVLPYLIFKVKARAKGNSTAPKRSAWRYRASGIDAFRIRSGRGVTSDAHQRYSLRHEPDSGARN